MRTMTLSQLKKRRSAFTLIEIMVATVIMVVLVGLVIQITSEVLNVWNRSSGKLAANAEARIAMDLLTQDLETAVFRNNGQQWFRAEKATLNGATGLDSATVSLSLFSPALDRPDGRGDICGISYRLDYANPIDGTSSGDLTYVLYRLVVNPQDTFEKLMGDTAQNVLPDGDGDDPEWIGRDGFRASIKGDGGSNYLVSNIVNFEIDFYVADDGKVTTETLVEESSIGLSDSTRFGSGLPGPSLNNGGATVGSQAYSWEDAPNPQQLAYRQPLAYAEIKLSVISDEAMKLLSSGKVSQTGLSVEEYVTANSETFTRRVNFLARPL